MKLHGIALFYPVNCHLSVTGGFAFVGRDSAVRPPEGQGNLLNRHFEGLGLAPYPLKERECKFFTLHSNSAPPPT